MNITLFLALWGAILATVVFGWDIVKWKRNTARLRFIVRPDTYYGDSEAVAVPGEPEGRKMLRPSIHIELNNVGAHPTTILNIWAERKMQNGGTVTDSGTSAIDIHYGKKLPYLLTVGDSFSCRFDQERLTRLDGSHPIKIFVAVSHLNKPLIKPVIFKDGGTKGGTT